MVRGIIIACVLVAAGAAEDNDDLSLIQTRALQMAEDNDAVSYDPNTKHSWNQGSAGRSIHEMERSMESSNFNRGLPVVQQGVDGSYNPFAAHSHNGGGAGKHLYPAWSAEYVEDACANTEAATGFLQTNTSVRSDPTTPHWTARRFKVEPENKKSATMLYYGSADIQEHVPNVAKIAVLFFHGAARDAINYFCSLRSIMAAQNGYDLPDVLMLALKFSYHRDLAQDEDAEDAEGDSKDDDDYEDTDYDNEEEFNSLKSDLWWNGSKKFPFGDYRIGAHSAPASGGEYSSFDVIDRMVTTLQDRLKYPGMREVLLAGHSAGGQTVHRYALTTHLAPPTSRLKVRYAVANPSSYTYLDENRWSYNCDKNGCTSGKYLGYEKNAGRSSWNDDGHRRRSSRRRAQKVDCDPSLRSCHRDRMKGKPIGFWGVKSASRTRHFVCRTTKAHDWGYGLDAGADAKKLVPYLTQRPKSSGGIAQAKAWYKKRDVIYLVGQNDTCTDDLIPGYCDPSCWTRDYIPPTARWQEFCYRTIMDMRCEAVLQGINRRQRAENYMHHLQAYYKAPVHELYTVNNVGHEAEKMYMTPGTLEKLFPGLGSEHDSSKCMQGSLEDPTHDPTCCAHHTSCDSGYRKVETGPCGFDKSYCQSNSCTSIQCLPPPPHHDHHDASKCRQWDGSKGCCGAGGGYCSDGFTKVVAARCGRGNEWCDANGCWSILCFAP